MVYLSASEHANLRDREGALTEGGPVISDTLGKLKTFGFQCRYRYISRFDVTDNV